MIDLGRPALHADGITVFADHADEAVYFYLPDGPRLRTTAAGDPELLLVEYRVPEAAAAALGSGLRSLSVDLGIEDVRLARLRTRLAARTGRSDVVLAPVLAESARADISLLGSSTLDPPPPAADQPAAPAALGAGPFLTRPLAVGAPLLAGDKAATFAAVLSAEGATLVEAAMRSGGLPLGIVYTLRVTGLRPALRARVTARWADVYSYYENRLHGGKLLAAVDLGTTVQDLVQSEAVTVEIDDLVPAGERSAADHRALDEVQRYVVQELFRPTLGSAPPPADAEAEGLAAVGTAIKDVFGLFALTYTLRTIDRRELKTLTYDLSTAAAEEVVLSPQGSFATSLDATVRDGASVDRLIRRLEPSASPEMVFDVSAARDLAGEDVDRVEVTLRYGDQQRDLVLDATTPRRTTSIWYSPDLGAAVTWSCTVHFVPATGDADVLTAPPRTTDARVIRIDPRELCTRRETRVVAAGLPFERYPRTLVDLRYTQPASGWTADVTLELAADHREAVSAVRTSSGLALLVQRRIRYVDPTGVVLTLDWENLGADSSVLVVGDPLPDVVDVQLLGSARFGTVVARLVVELRPRADPGRVDTRVLTAAAPVAAWSWAVREAADRGYDYRVTVHSTAGEVTEGPWRPGVPGKLVVGEGFAALREIALYLVGGSLASRGLLAVKVRFAYADAASSLSAEHEVLVTDARDPVPWTCPVAAPDRTAYTVQLTAIGLDGRQQPQPPLTTSDLVVVAVLPTLAPLPAPVPVPVQG